MHKWKKGVLRRGSGTAGNHFITFSSLDIIIYLKLPQSKFANVFVST